MCFCYYIICFFFETICFFFNIVYYVILFFFIMIYYITIYMVFVLHHIVFIALDFVIWFSVFISKCIYIYIYIYLERERVCVCVIREHDDMFIYRAFIKPLQVADCSFFLLLDMCQMCPTCESLFVSVYISQKKTVFFGRGKTPVTSKNSFQSKSHLEIHIFTARV